MEDIEDDKRSLLDAYADFPGIRMNEKTWKNIVEVGFFLKEKF